MNQAATRMMARSPVISGTSLRFLRMAKVGAREFLAGFRIRTGGECLNMSTPSALRLPVARKARMHGGGGEFFSGSSGKIRLTYDTDAFSYAEDAFLNGPLDGVADARLTLWNQKLPDTVVTALPGRRLTDLIGGGCGTFLAAKQSRIVQAEVLTYPGSTALQLALRVPWHVASRALPSLR